MTTLSRAIAIAAQAHAGQVDKAGQPYILHPLRVMLKMETDEERIVAVLHDVVEDCPAWSLARLDCEWFGEPVIDALDALTRRKGETYADFIERAGRDDLGRKVKIADIEDNLSPERRTSLPSGLEERYRKALRSLHLIELIRIGEGIEG